MTEAIIVEEVHKRFGDVHALAGVSLSIPEQTVFALLGPNGAGKTTLVNVLTTLLFPDAGHASVLGLDVVNDRQHLRNVIGLAGQYAAVDQYLTGRENLIMVGELYHLGRATARKRADELLVRFSLVDAADRPAKTYSGGMRHRLDLAASLVGNPKVLFLDEPTTGLDPRTRLDMWNLIRELVREGTTLMLTTQYLEEADELADQIAVIDEGRIIAEGTADALKSQIGKDVLELRIEDNGRLSDAAAVLRSVSSEELQTEPETGRLFLPVTNGASTVIDVVRRLDSAAIDLAELSLRRPSLDDVFLSLTGRRAQEHANGQTGHPADQPQPAARSETA
ncbi:MAG: ATP-binding cassette domain-containing protein [Chloroflexi bacterium]|nr:ATP-binding cassette domain-containing protein [Chloroflexota bacterium]